MKAWALVTGASRGIGAAIAQKLLDEGYQVIGTATSEKGLENIKAMGGHGQILNLTSREDVERCAKDIQSKHGCVPTVLVNNAGITRDQLCMRLKADAWDEVIETNLSAQALLTQSLIRPMIKNNWGRIVHISSVVAFTGNPGQCNYTAAKAGLIGFSKSLAHEVASRGITVNCVAPGFIATDMTDKLTEAQKESILPKIPMGRMGTPDDIAQAVAFLVSEGAQYVTGQTLHVNGGMYMGF